MLFALGGLILILAGTLYIIKEASYMPFLAVGWLWYLITLLPVIGLVQVGQQAQEIILNNSRRPISSTTNFSKVN